MSEAASEEEEVQGNQEI
ncbi:hypothetical protein A2U01_0113062, partial [Trifolium medium]|nr:hypothetical protein [Trifolium medium]